MNSAPGGSQDLIIEVVMNLRPSEGRLFPFGGDLGPVFIETVSSVLGRENTISWKECRHRLMIKEISLFEAGQGRLQMESRPWTPTLIRPFKVWVTGISIDVLNLWLSVKSPETSRNSQTPISLHRTYSGASKPSIVHIKVMRIIPKLTARVFDFTIQESPSSTLTILFYLPWTQKEKEHPSPLVIAVFNRSVAVEGRPVPLRCPVVYINGKAFFNHGLNWTDYIYYANSGKWRANPGKGWKWKGVPLLKIESAMGIMRIFVSTLHQRQALKTVIGLYITIGSTISKWSGGQKALLV